MTSEKVVTNPLKAIRKNCIECSGGSYLEVELCPCTTCPMYPFRFGKNPYRAKRVLTEEQKADIASRLTNWRKASE